MKEFKVKLNSIDDVKEFVGSANACTLEIDLLSGRYAVDAKSIMGIFSLDLTKELTMVVHTDSEDGEEFLEEVDKFIIH